MPIPTDDTVLQFPARLRELMNLTPDSYLYLSWTPMNPSGGRGMTRRGRLDWTPALEADVGAVSALLTLAAGYRWEGWGSLNASRKKLRDAEYVESGTFILHFPAILGSVTEEGTEEDADWTPDRILNILMQARNLMGEFNNLGNDD